MEGPTPTEPSFFFNLYIPILMGPQIQMPSMLSHNPSEQRAPVPLLGDIAAC